MEGLSRAMFSSMDESWCLVSCYRASPSRAPASYLWGSSMGQLVTDSRFLMASPYSSQIRSIDPKGSLPFFEEKPWTMLYQDLNVGRDAHDACAPGYWPLVGPSYSTPHSKGAPEWL